MHPAQLAIKDFSYHLPEEKIARFPLKERDESRLLIFKDNQIQEDRYIHLANYLPQGALMVFNNTRVIEARILFQKPTGGVIEIFTLEPDDSYPDISTAMKEQGKVVWKCLIGGASKWKHGQELKKELEVDGIHIVIEARITALLQGSFLVAFNWQPQAWSFAEILNSVGLIPIPPYLKRDSDNTDKDRYQTIYASKKGSVAAPTAGLHFTESLLDALHSNDIETAFITLHVGAGTFMPVKSSQMQQHEMHAEYIEVSTTFIKMLMEVHAGIFPVGTTSLRAIESLYWMGVKTFLNPAISYDLLGIQQWEVYDTLNAEEISTSAALNALLHWMEVQKMDTLIIQTRILIAPGYNFKLTAGLVTNFHQPQSTLLLLVAALTGSEWRNIYEFALAENFRFLSYGDGCLLYPIQRSF